MTIDEAARKATDVADSIDLGEPVAVIYVFPQESFVAVGDVVRDGEYVSRLLIEVAGHELGAHYERMTGL